MFGMSDNPKWGTSVVESDKKSVGESVTMQSPAYR